MGLNRRDYYEISCDEPGCDINTSELGDFSAWGSVGNAIDDWINSDGSEIDGSYYCYKHFKEVSDDEDS